MEYQHMNQKKGVAGLSVLLSVIAMLFMIGLIVMVFVIAGSKLQTAVETSGSAGNFYNETVPTVNDAGDVLAQFSSYQGATGCSAIRVTNETSGTIIASGNYSLGAETCNIKYVATGVGDQQFNGTGWNVTYTFSYVTDGFEASQTINDTYNSLDDVTDWFPTFIVLTAMVVLILLVVIIINSIKGSGITGGA